MTTRRAKLTRLPLPLMPRLAFLLANAAAMAACGGGGSGEASADETDSGAVAGTVTVSGTANYEFPPPAANCNGLNFDKLLLRPIRQATVQIVDGSTGAVLDETLTSDSGEYSVTVNSDHDVHMRIRAELKKTGSPSWDVEVRDNTSRTELDITSRPLYVLDGARFNTGASNVQRDITATTGWGGSSYTGTRSAAPFAILDAVYDGMRLVMSVEPTISFEELDVFWSINNTATDGERNIAEGELGTSFYSSDNRLFLLGMDGVDTEEFDDHVIVHEWGHYYEDAISRSDSIGGAHGVGDFLDKRVAFGEGFATAFSGMALDSPQYCDTLWSGGELRGFHIDIESHAAGTDGWFNEITIIKILYDLWDTNEDIPADTSSIGFAPIHSVMSAAQVLTPVFTSIFSFAEALKEENPQHAAFIDALLNDGDIRAEGINAYGEGETNGAELLSEDVLPVYTEVIPDGSVINVCSNSRYDRSGFDLHATGNKLSEHRFLHMTIDAAVPYTFEIVTTTEMAPDDPEDDHDQSDPDILIVRDGVRQNALVDGRLQGFSGDAIEEKFTTPEALPTGDYAMALTEFRYHDEETPEDYPEQTCFNVSVSPAP